MVRERPCECGWVCIYKEGRRCLGGRARLTEEGLVSCVPLRPWGSLLRLAMVRERPCECVGWAWVCIKVINIRWKIA